MLPLQLDILAGHDLNHLGHIQGLASHPRARQDLQTPFEGFGMLERCLMHRPLWWRVRDLLGSARFLRTHPHESSEGHA
jgi:hypothetical protein